MTPLTKKTIIAGAIVVLICVLSYFGFLVGAAVISYRAVIRSGNEAATIQNLRTIAAVEAQYFNSHNRTFATLDQLINEQLLSSKFRGHPSVADGYVFTLTLTSKPDGSSSCKITADPQNADTGTNHFYVDFDDDRIRVNPDREAGPADPFI
jgi:Tfp pilus assembly protein PilE